MRKSDVVWVLWGTGGDEKPWARDRFVRVLGIYSSEDAALAAGDEFFGEPDWWAVKGIVSDYPIDVSVKDTIDFIQPRGGW